MTGAGGAIPPALLFSWLLDGVSRSFTASGVSVPLREINTVSAVCGSSCTVFSRRAYKNHMDSKTLLCFAIWITSSSRRLFKYVCVI